MNAILLATRKKRLKKLLHVLQGLFPNPEEMKTVLKYKTPWQLLVAVALSAQCTDERVNMVTKDLFKKYPKVEDIAKLSQTKLEKEIYSTGFYKNKAKNVLAAARQIITDHSGRVPRTLSELVQLPGVGRKTANVVLGNLYGTREGIAVDTHVRRFAIKFDLTDYTDAKRIESDLMKIVPREYWVSISYYMIMYGREICTARKHDCSNHPCSKIFPPAANNWPKAK